MIYGFVRQSGGTLDIQSTPEEGTTVTLYLPRGSSMTTESEEPDATSSTGLDVLLVEDDKALRDVFSKMLSRDGYDIRICETATDAIEALKKSTPDIVVTDIQLAGDMNGAELARAIRTSHPGLPVLLISGNPEATLTEADFDAHAVLKKPFSFAQLRTTIEKAASH